MKKQVLIGAIVFLSVASLGYAQEQGMMQGPEIKGTASLTYTGKYVWRGFNVFGSKSAIHPMIDLFAPEYGVGASLEVHRANASGYEIAERWDYSLYYLGKMFEDECYAINYRLGYVYYNYPQQSSHTRGENPWDYPTTFTLDKGTFDLEEGHAVLSFPKLLGVEGLVPTYVLVKLWPANSGTVVGAKSPTGGTASGWAHIFMLDYTVPLRCPITGIDRKVNFHSEFIFNDGVAPDGGGTRGPADHDWSNAVFGVSTNYEIEENLFLTPGFYYQSSWDDSVNSSDQYWGSLGVSYKF
jgi:hypothetical protein